MKNFILSLLLMSFFVGSAQTLQRGKSNSQNRPDTTKYSKQIQAIVNSYDQAKLTNLFNEISPREAAEKTEAVTFALVNNLPIRYEDEDGTLLELQFISDEGIPIYYTTYNSNAAISTRANYLNTGGGLALNLNGDNLTAHVWDGGLARSTHQEYDGAGGSNRFSIGDGTSALHYHSAHVTGTIIASGVQAAAKGMAWQADAVGYDWNSDTSEATTAASGGMLISNHSYGYGASTIPDAWFGQYGPDAVDWDNILYNAPYYLMMVAAGNDGADNTSNAAPLDGQTAYDKLSGHATAKNNLVVGNGQDASINGDGSLGSMIRNSGSSEGPTDDYRIKPDIMGNGTQLYSTYETSDTAYNSISGTSMASPNVAGTLLLLQEHYNNVNSSFMRAATLKGLALHTADDTATNGPDAETGWGLLNAKAAAEAITAAPTSAVVSELTLSQGGTYQVTIQSDGVNPLLASISWTDPAGTLNNGTNSNTPALVNDLDLRLNNGTNYTPWRLTGVTTNGTGDNIVDPFERIDISGASGQYTLTVIHKGTLSSGSQDFSLIVTGGTIAASSPEISYGTITTTTTEGTDCSFTDVTVPLNIAMAPSQDADVTFSVAGGSATVGVDYEIFTPSVTFLQGQTVSHDLIVRFYNEGFVESAETAIIDFTVNANGGDATANPAADSLTITVNDDDFAPPTTQDVTVLAEDFEDWTGWLNMDRDGDTNVWVSISFTSGGYTGFSGQFAASETDLTVLGGIGSANANNYLVSPQMTIPANTTNTAFNFAVGGFNTVEHYRLQWTTDISTYAAIDAGIILEEGDAIAGGGEIRVVNNATLAGQTGYFVIRHFNSSANNGLLLFDALEIVATVDSPVQTAVNDGTTNDLVDLPGAGTMYASDSASGDIMMAITNNNTDDYGCIDVSVSRAGTGAQSYNGSTSPDLVMDKTFAIAPGNIIASGSTSITFYFTELEIQGWETGVGGTIGVTRNTLVAARDIAGSVVETSALTLGSFGAHVTLTGNFTGLSNTFYFGSINAFLTNCAGANKTWDGSNWSPLGDPDITNPVIIAGAYDTATDGDLDACELTVLTGNVLTVQGLTYVNVNGNITVDGSLIVEHQGSVVQVDGAASVTNNGIINVELTTPFLKPYDFMIMGSPMTAETRADVFSNAYIVRNHLTGNFVPNGDVAAAFPLAENFADDNGDNWLTYSGTINPAEGYLVFPQAFSGDGNAPYDLTYTQGTLNNGDHTFTALYNGTQNASPNILANPYASSIFADDFINANSNVDAIYFWEHVTPPSAGIPGYSTMNFTMEDISMYNLTGGTAATTGGTTPNGYIATGQGFSIKASAGGPVSFTNAMRRVDNNNTLRTQSDRDRLWLSVRNEQYEMQSNTLLGFLDEASAGVDTGYDSKRLATVVSLYSHLPNGELEFGIQARESFDPEMTIPMGFSSLIESELTYRISIEQLEGINLSNATVYLVDHYENTITNLNEGAYDFVSYGGTYNNRFTIQFETEILGTNDATLESVVLYPNPTKDLLTIVSPTVSIQAVTLYDISGRKVSENSFGAKNVYQVDLSDLESAIYLVEISTEKGTTTKQVVKH